MKQPWHKNPAVWLALLIPLMVAAGVMIGNYLISPAPEIPVQPSAEKSATSREAILYFGSLEGTHLIGEIRQLEECGELTECLTETVQALILGPEGNLLPILPSGTRVRDVSENDGIAVLNFSRELVSAHPGGTLSELLTVFGLADTLAANFPHIRQIRILVEGQPVSTLKGHVDLRQPVAANFQWAREISVPAPSPQAGPSEKD